MLLTLYPQQFYNRIFSIRNLITETQKQCSQKLLSKTIKNKVKYKTSKKVKESLIRGKFWIFFIFRRNYERRNKKRNN